MASRDGRGGSPRQIRDVIQDVLREREDVLRGPADRVSFEAPLADSGIDSISLVFVFAHFERAHDVTFENEELDPRRYSCLADVAATIERRLPVR